MTTELLIMTPSVVVLAADSAITVFDLKTYNGVDKIFKLSNNPPMGIMIYNNASFLDIPFETIIKEFRNNIKSKKLSKLNDFKQSFENYIRDFVLKNCKVYSFESLVDDFLYLIKGKYKNSYDEFVNFVNNYMIDFNHKDLNPFLEEITYKLEDNEYKFCDLLEENLNLQESFLNKFKNIFIQETFFDNYTGIVIAGFEGENFLPNAISFKLNYLYENNFILRDFENYSVKEEGVVFKTFAQSDVIDTFLNSVDDETEIYILNYFNYFYRNFLSNLTNVIEDNSNIGDEDKIIVLEEINNLKLSKDEFNNEFLYFLEDLKFYHWNPISLLISALPKEELSNMAELMIKITSLKRKVEFGLDSVGGDVDVAFITKNEGFVWKEKNPFFDMDLNPRFLEDENHEI